MELNFEQAMQVLEKMANLLSHQKMDFIKVGEFEMKKSIHAGPQVQVDTKLKDLDEDELSFYSAV